MNTAAVAALGSSRKTLYEKLRRGYYGGSRGITLSGGTIVSTKEDYKNMYTTLAVSTEDIFFIAKSRR